MAKLIRCFPFILGALVFSSAASGQYTLDLTGVGDGANNGSVYYSPYAGTISNSTGQQIYSGYMICDDFNTESYLNTPWKATETNAGSLNGTEKFAGEKYTLGGTTYGTAQMYNAVAYLATQLLSAGNLTNSTNQGNLSFAMWDIMDGTIATGTVLTDIQSAFSQVMSGYVGNNVEIFTPSPDTNASQEFLVVNGPPVSTPEPTAATLLGFDLLSVMGLAFVLHRRLRRKSSLAT